MYVYQAGCFSLKFRENAADGSQCCLISDTSNTVHPVNDTAAIVWECCRDPILVADLVQMLVEGFPQAASLEADVLSVLDRYHELGLVEFTRDRCRKMHYRLDYQPEPGERSNRAERLVDFCLGEFKDKPVLPCSRDLDYLDQTVLLLEAGIHSLVLSAGLDNTLVDQKKVVEALISQRAMMPPGLRCWLVRDDSAGAFTIPEQGLHIAAMRPRSRRDLVLVPSANRKRYLGPNLRTQMEELRRSWVPWEEKTDTAWWGGAITGNWRRKNAAQALTRREVLCYFRDNPSDHVLLNPTKLPENAPLPPGVELQSAFTKQSAFMNKCLVLLPGNDIASGSSWFFCGNSVVLMPEPHLDHILYFELEPWVHYVPLENDPADILTKLEWVLNNQDKARQMVGNAHDRLRWLSGPEYRWACNEVLRRISEPAPGSIQ